VAKCPYCEKEFIELGTAYELHLIRHELENIFYSLRKISEKLG